MYIEVALGGATAQGDEIFNCQLEKGSTATAHEDFVSVADKIVDFNGTIYGGNYNSTTGILTSTKAADGTDLNPHVETDIGVTPISSILGNNNIYCDTGGTSVDYRSSGTITPVPVQSTLITKNITENDTYYAADDNADGYSSVTVNVSASPTWDVNMDFTGITDAYTVNGVTYNSTGAVFDSTSDYIALPFIHSSGVEIEIDVSSMSLNASQHRRFVISNTNNGLFYSRDSGKWAFYNGTTYTSEISDGSYFANSTVKIVVDTNNYWHIYKDGVLVFEPAGALALKNVTLGSTSTSMNSATITAIRMKATA